MRRAFPAVPVLLFAVACGPNFPFTPSNVDRELLVSGGDDLIFDADTCGPRAEIDTETGQISCFRPGVYSPPFSYTMQRGLAQPGGPALAMLVARNIRIAADTEVQLRGPDPVVLVALETLIVDGAITAQDAILQYQAHAGGAHEPDSSATQGLGAGGGLVALEGSGAGGGSYCGRGGTGGNDTDPSSPGAAGGNPYGTENLVPLLAGSSGGKNANHSGAGGGAVQLIAGNRIEIAGTGLVNMGGLGGGWFGNGGGSGGAILIEAPEVIMAGTLAVNGGAGGGGPSAGGGDGANAEGSAIAASGGEPGAGGGRGGDGSAGATPDGADGAAGTTGGGGGGGAGRIRINASGGANVTGTLSPAPGVCTTEGTIDEE